MKSRITKISLVCMAAVMLLACGGGGGGGGGATPTPTATPTATPTPTPTPEPATNVTINSIDISACAATVAYVTVTDEYNELVTGLTQSAFTLLLDGSPFDIDSVSFVEHTSTPVSVSFVMDYSRSSTVTLAAMKEAAISFIEGMDNDDEGEIIRFAGEYKVTQPFTTNKDFLKDAINSEFADQTNTNVWSPLIQAVTDAADPLRTGRGAVIIFTDGFHNYTVYDEVTVDDVIAPAQANGIPVFAIGYLIQRETDRENLQRLAEETGGVFLEAPSTESFVELYQQIADIIQHQYRVTFAGGVGTHDLQINVTAGGETGMSNIRQYTCVGEVE